MNRALDVMFLIAGSDRPLTASVISQRLGIPRPTVYRIVDTLSDRGLVARVGGGYAVTLRLDRLTLTHAAVRLSDMIVPYLHGLVAATEETSGLHVRTGALRRCVAEIEGYHGIRWARGVGFTAPVWSGAVGHVLLAGMTTDAVHELLQRIVLRPLAANTPVEAADLLDRVEVARASGWAGSVSETVDGASAVAAPILDHRGSTVAAVSLYAPADRYSDLLDLLPDLLQVAKEASDEWVRLSSGRLDTIDRRMLAEQVEPSRTNGRQTETSKEEA